MGAIGVGRGRSETLSPRKSFRFQFDRPKESCIGATITAVLAVAQPFTANKREQPWAHFNPDRRQLRLFIYLFIAKMKMPCISYCAKETFSAPTCRPEEDSYGESVMNVSPRTRPSVRPFSLRGVMDPHGTERQRRSLFSLHFPATSAALFSEITCN